jgi:hypothetical protein
MAELLSRLLAREDESALPQLRGAQTWSGCMFRPDLNC